MYGIKVPMAVDDYVWVIDDSKSTWDNPKPLLFRSKDTAIDYALSVWGELAKVKRYRPS